MVSYGFPMIWCSTVLVIHVISDLRGVLKDVDAVRIKFTGSPEKNHDCQHVQIADLKGNLAGEAVNIWGSTPFVFL